MLSIEQLDAFYGNSQVLRGVTLAVAPGEVLALLGRNGSGRTSLARAVMGQIDALGSVRWRGQQLLGRKTFQIARLGIGYVPESRDIFSDLTVAQNLLLGQKNHQTGRRTLADMYQLFPLLQARAQTRAGVLSGGEQQMLALCRTLMGDPELIIVDEPAEGLAPQMVQVLGDCLRSLKAQGVSVLLIEQKLTLALRLADRCCVMGRGQVVFDGTPTALMADAAVRQEWLEI